jgi:ATP synthase protein I
VESKLTDDDKEPAKQIGAFITIPFVLAVPPVIGWLIGSWLDKTFHSHSIFMYSLVILGFIAGFREVYRIVKRFGNDV